MLFLKSKIKNNIVNTYSKIIYNGTFIYNINNIINNYNFNEELITNYGNPPPIPFKSITIDDSTIKNIENNQFIYSVESRILTNYSNNWCMKELNTIDIPNNNEKLELLAIGISEGKITILNAKNLTIHQTINGHKSSVYSLDQFENDFNYLFSSSNDTYINIYKLNINNFQYQLIQKLSKERDKGGEINKVITLKNKLLVSGDHKTITIWKQKDNTNDGNLEYFDFYQIMINQDTCHLLEVNPNMFVAAQYSQNGTIQLYENNGENFPKIGEIKNAISHGSNSNRLSKINDNYFCCANEKNCF